MWKSDIAYLHFAYFWQVAHNLENSCCALNQDTAPNEHRKV